jgi:hypothetical protein
MTKSETLGFIKKIKAYYPMFKLEEEGINEWIDRLKPYDLSDILEKFEKHLEGEYSATEPPKLHYLTKFLKTTEQKEKAKDDYLIRCNLCGEEMYLSIYDGEHYEKCCLIKSLLILLKKRGENVSYEDLDKYPLDTLQRTWDKYMPLKKEIDI